MTIYRKVWAWLKWMYSAPQRNRDRAIRERIYWLARSNGKRSWTGSIINNDAEIQELKISLSDSTITVPPFTAPSTQPRVYSEIVDPILEAEIIE